MVNGAFPKTGVSYITGLTGSIFPLGVFLVSQAMIQPRRIKADPVNPLFEHGHREAQAVDRAEGVGRESIY
jgi:hypothetical protein